MQEATTVQVVETADDLLKARPLRIVAVPIAYFGKTVHFRELTGAGIDLYLSVELNADGKTAKVNREYLIGHLQNTICSPTGKLLFDAPSGRSQLESLGWDGLQELFGASAKAIGMTKERVEEKKAA